MNRKDFDPAAEMEKYLVRKLDEAVARQEEAMTRMERLIANRRENAAAGNHYEELNVGNIATEIARHAAAAAGYSADLQYHRMLAGFAESDEDLN